MRPLEWFIKDREFANGFVNGYEASLELAATIDDLRGFLASKTRSLDLMTEINDRLMDLESWNDAQRKAYSQILCLLTETGLEGEN